MMFEISYLIPAVSALLVCLMAVYTLSISRRVAKSERVNADLLDAMSQEVQGISHGSMGVGRKVLALEKSIQQLEAKLEEQQKNDPAKVSYSEAARLVQLGAGVEDLMNSCGISRPEAELVKAMTSSTKAEGVPVLVPEP